MRLWPLKYADINCTLTPSRLTLPLFQQAIYEQKFHHSRTASGQRLFKLSIDIDLQKEQEVTIIEKQALLPKQSPSTQPAAAASSTSPSSPCDVTEIRHVPGNGSSSGNSQRGRGRGRGRARGRGKKDAQMLQTLRDVPALGTSAQTSVFSMQCMAASLEEKPEASTSTLQEAPLQTSRERTTRLQYLLPVELLATLPAEYPLEKPPSVELRCRWLSRGLEEQLMARLRLCKQFAVYAVV